MTETLIDWRNRAKCAHCERIMSRPHRADFKQFCSYTCAVEGQPEHATAALRNTEGLQS